MGVYNSADVLDNTVSGVAATSGGNGNAFGLYIYFDLNDRVVGNGVRGLVSAGTGSAYGIYSPGSNRITLVGNHVFGDGSTGVGLLCQGPTGSAMDNVVSGFATGIVNCRDDGGNAIVP
jgi:hypothetical protein